MPKPQTGLWKQIIVFGVTDIAVVNKCSSSEKKKERKEKEKFSSASEYVVIATYWGKQISHMNVISRRRG